MKGNKKSNKRKNISTVMEILIKEFSKKRKPTVRKISQKRDPFKVLISCLLSLRTRDENTALAASRLFHYVKKPEDLVKMPLKKIENLIYPSGFYKKKARTLREVALTLIKKFKGKVPNTKKELLSIKGIGQKTANIVLSFAYKKAVLPIDTHCHRIPNRLGWVKTAKPEQTEKELEKILPKKYWREFNTVMILFGRTICLPLSPLCSKCPIRKYCKRIGVKKSR